MALSEDPADYEFDIAVSFAGEEREFVENVIAAVNAADTNDVRVFYDRENRYDSWGQNLVEYFTDVYLRRARFVIMFFSASYAEKEWTRLERRTSLERALEQKSEYILPVQMDSTEISSMRGLLQSTAYLNAEVEGVDGIASAIHHKIGRARAAAPSYRPKIANTARELQELIAVRPPAWEYLVWASAIRQGVNALADLRRDHDLGYGTPSGRRVRDKTELMAAVSDVLDDLNQVVENANKIISGDAFQAAVGAPGVAGDLDRIIHVAQRFVDVYGGLIRIGTDLWGTSIRSEWAGVLDAAGHLTDMPLRGFDAFFEEMFPLVESLPTRLETGENIEINLVVRVHMDDDLGYRVVELLKEAVADESQS
ncbi:TIR domain-containing protein [Nocardia salmonicida]|uniref:TIR domain-containing protein n=1 Tax=Nocardia salmonicida TaxID=53431 RepID=UPI00364D7E83